MKKSKEVIIEKGTDLGPTTGQAEPVKTVKKPSGERMPSRLRLLDKKHNIYEHGGLETGNVPITEEEVFYVSRRAKGGRFEIRTARFFNRKQRRDMAKRRGIAKAHDKLSNRKLTRGRIKYRSAGKGRILLPTKMQRFISMVKQSKMVKKIEGFFGLRGK